MKIKYFFTEVLGANLRNSRWSWGAVDPITNRIFLRVWKDKIKKHKNGERIVVGNKNRVGRSNGHIERMRHLELIKNGAESYGVVCIDNNPSPEKNRVISSFDDTALLKLGKLTYNKNGIIYADIIGRIPVSNVSRQRTGLSTLSEDIKSIENKKINSTTKDTLINARVGQGLFRSQVLSLWNNSCSVTRSKTLDAIRASHIKPWRDCSDKERLDPYNGLPLISNLDSLFDAGLITFNKNGELLVSTELSNEEQKIFCVQSRKLKKRPNKQTAEYLLYHYNNVFKK